MPLQSVRKVADADFPTRWGHFRILGFEGDMVSPEPCREGMVAPRVRIEGAVALVMGDIHSTPPIVRIHSQCLTGDVLASERCDCRAQLELSLSKIGKAPAGVLLYLPQEGRGIGLMNKLRAYQLQDSGMDTVEANRSLGFADDARNYSFSAAILKLLGAKNVRLLSNNPDKVSQLETAGIRITERVPCQPETNHRSRKYLRTKKQKLGHLLIGL